MTPLKWLVVVTVVALAFGLAVILTTRPKEAGVQASAPVAGFAAIDAGQLAERLKNKQFTLVNVHLPYEGEIKGTDVVMRFDTIAANLDALPADKTAEIVIYCRSGRKSAIAAATLAGLGYTNVANLAGGMIDWRRRGGEIVFR